MNIKIKFQSSWELGIETFRKIGFSTWDSEDSNEYNFNLQKLFICFIVKMKHSLLTIFNNFKILSFSIPPLWPLMSSG